MIWEVKYLPEAENDYDALARNQQIIVAKAIKKVKTNPLSVYEGGYGKPLGHKGETNLTSLLKIKFRDLGIRVVYKIEHTDTIMKIIIVSARTDDQVYKEAQKRRLKHGL